MSILLQDFLRVNVPPEIQAVLDRGGVNDRDWAWLQQDSDTEETPLNIIMRADEYLLFPSNREKQQKGLLIFRKTVTILAFVPGGVRLFGLHFSPSIPGYVEPDKYSESWYGQNLTQQEEDLVA